MEQLELTLTLIIIILHAVASYCLYKKKVNYISDHQKFFLLNLSVSEISPNIVRIIILMLENLQPDKDVKDILTCIQAVYLMSVTVAMSNCCCCNGKRVNTPCRPFSKVLRPKDKLPFFCSKRKVAEWRGRE